MTENRHLLPQKIRGFGLGRTPEESADSVADSESVTTLVDFLSVFAHSASAVTPSEKGSINTVYCVLFSEPKMNIVHCP